MTTLRVGDAGVSLEVRFVDENGAVVDVSTASVKEIVIRPDLGAAQVKTATFLTTGVDGIIRYVTHASDLNSAGIWRIQGHVVMGTVDQHSLSHVFQVDDILK